MPDFSGHHPQKHANGASFLHFCPVPSVKRSFLALLFISGDTMAPEIQRVLGLFGACLKGFPGGTPGPYPPAFS